MTINKIVAKTLVLNNQNQLLALHRSNHMRRRPGQWDLPGGAADGGEDVTEAAIREVSEETGIGLSTTDLQLVYVRCAMENNQNIISLLFITRVATMPVSLSEEHDHYQWMSFKEAISTFEHIAHVEAFKYVRENKLDLLV